MHVWIWPAFPFPGFRSSSPFSVQPIRVRVARQHNNASILFINCTPFKTFYHVTLLLFYHGFAGFCAKTLCKNIIYLSYSFSRLFTGNVTIFGVREKDLIPTTFGLSRPILFCKRRTRKPQMRFPSSLSLLYEKELVRNPWFYWVLPSFSLQIYYNIKKHSLQYKNAESSLGIYYGNAKQTPAKLQPLSNNIFSW